MKRIISLILVLSMILTFASCAKVPVQDDSPITMYIGLGNTKTTYYTALKELIKEELGYDVEFVYSNTLDTTNTMNQMIKNGDLPTDIIVTASRTNEEYQENAFLNLSTETNLPDLFTSNQIKQIDVDGSVYQLPFSTRLIGIEYNKTLFEEYNLELPSSLEEMIALKAKAEELGLKFSTTGATLTGHGFNYLFHLLGTNYIFGADGTEWLANYRSGNASIDEFKEEASYFEKFVEAGLFGSIHSEDWNASTEFKETRALFYFNIINDTYSYDGFQYDDDGKIVGAEYIGDEVVAEEATDGIAVEIDGKYVLYDEANEAHQGLTRYNIPGATVLHDKYGSMPWISENGNSNCYVTYNNMYLAINKKLGEEDQAKRLAKIVDILELMTTDKAARLFTELYPDGYVAVKDFSIDNTRLYADFADSVEKGYIMPWYYNEFDNECIVSVGQVVNDYLLGKDTFENIFVELDKDNTAFLNHTPKTLAKVSETLDYKDVAKLQCVANALSSQKVLDDNGIDAKIEVSILPYVNNINELPLEVNTPIVQSKIYKGDIEEVLLNSYIQGTAAPVIVKMSGSDINALVESGYNTNTEFGVDKTFDIAVMTKNGISIDDSKSYYVAVPSKILVDSYDKYLADGAVITKDDAPLAGTTLEGLTMYFENHQTISKTNIEWK